MPYPAPTISQLALCSGLACRRRGYHTSGTVIVRPSSKSTLRLSSEKRTSRTASPALSSEVLIPAFQQDITVFGNQPLDHTQLSRGKTKIASQGDGLEPELGRKPVSVNMNVGGLFEVMADEVYSVGSTT